MYDRNLPTTRYSDALSSTLRAGEPFRVVFLGDSLTSTEWVHPNWREIVEYVLKQQLSGDFVNWTVSSWGIRCYNAGFDGASSRDWLRMLQAEVIALRPTMVLVVGTDNEHWFNVSPVESAANISAIIRDLRTAKIPEIAYATAFAELGGHRRSEYDRYAAQVVPAIDDPNISVVDMVERFAALDLSKLYTFRHTDDDPVTGRVS